jgi:putative transposase
VSANRAAYSVATMCRALGVSESGYHAWRRRAPSPRARRDGELAALIRASHAGSDATYGAPRVREDLAGAGHRVGRKRVARLMRAEGLVGVSRRRGPPRPKRTTPEAPQAPDLVKRDFTADAPDRLWVADITYVPTYAGFLYLAVVLDTFSRRVVGWAMSSSLHTAVVLEALQMAAAQRRPAGVIHHSDQGSQYGALAFGQRCKALGVRPSMGSRGDAYDNAMAESFFATLECELLARRRFASHAEARLAIFRYVEGWYNPHRRHSALGQRSPLAFERAYAARALSPPTPIAA